MSKPPSGLFGKIMGYLFGGFGSILFVASILVFIAWKPLGNPPAKANLALAIVLLVVFFFQAGFNAWQDWSSARVMASIGTMLPDQCIVIRDGSHTSISAVDLLPGDIVVVKQGNKLPADLRFVEVSSDAMFDRAILTGTWLRYTCCLYRLTLIRRVRASCGIGRCDRRQLPRDPEHRYARYSLYLWKLSRNMCGDR